MRSRWTGLLAGVSALLGVLMTVSVAYGLTLADGWARGHLGLPASFVGYSVTSAGREVQADAAGQVLVAIGDASATLVVTPAAGMGAAAVGVMDTTGAVPLLRDVGSAGAQPARAPEAPGASTKPWVVLVEGSYTAGQVVRSGTATFLPPGSTVIGTTGYPMLPRDTQYLYALGGAPLPSGDYFIDASKGVETAIVTALTDAGFQVEPIERPPLAQVVASDPFTTVFAILLAGAFVCVALLVVNQFTFHRSRVDVHRLHGAHTGALLRLLAPVGIATTSTGTLVGSALTLLLGRRHLDVVSAGMGWFGATCLTLAAAALGVAIGSRRTREAAR
ncbi:MULTISPECIES: hypothetical protein [unclassified Actinotalea]|uniref:hypothetical protein n=1 Tax=unclassified Actinotalea TaxID=2638618 RepID=UPI0015F6CAA4|nr:MULTISPECIES: hypothetical protein [unclassified Actinotalea]